MQPIHAQDHLDPSNEGLQGLQSHRRVKAGQGDLTTELLFDFH
jgi:hypothetical protein